MSLKIITGSSNAVLGRVDDDCAWFFVAGCGLQVASCNRPALQHRRLLPSNISITAVSAVGKCFAQPCPDEYSARPLESLPAYRGDFPLNAAAQRWGPSLSAGFVGLKDGWSAY